MDIKRIRLGSNSWRRAKQRQVSILPGRGTMEGKKWEKQAKSVEWRENKAMLSWGRDEGPKAENGERIREIWLVNVPNLITRDSPYLLIWSRQFLMWRKLHVDIPPSAAPNNWGKSGRPCLFYFDTQGEFTRNSTQSQVIHYKNLIKTNYSYIYFWEKVIVYNKKMSVACINRMM